MRAKNRCAGCLLAGGQSRRMGSDKALLIFNGEPLWSRQLSLLGSLANPVVVAAPGCPEWLPAGVNWIADHKAAEGPLAGLLPALTETQNAGLTHLVALAVDLPRMEAAILRSLMEACRPGVGVVPENNKQFEPLAAVYPIEAIPVLQEAVSAVRWKLQEVLAELVASGFLRPFPIQDPSAFANLNTPADLAGML